MSPRPNAGLSDDALVVVDGLVTAFFGGAGIDQSAAVRGKFERSMPIVAETERILNRRNFRLHSKTKISDGSERRFFGMCRKICAWNSARYHHLEQSSGSEGEYCGVE